MVKSPETEHSTSIFAQRKQSLNVVPDIIRSERSLKKKAEEMEHQRDRESWSELKRDFNYGNA